MLKRSQNNQLMKQFRKKIEMEKFHLSTNFSTELNFKAKVSTLLFVFFPVNAFEIVNHWMFKNSSGNNCRDPLELS